NLTGMDFPFDALADPGIRRPQVAKWREWWVNAAQETSPRSVLALLSKENAEDRLRGVRALGSIGGPEGAPKGIEALKPFTSRPISQPRTPRGGCANVELTSTERSLAQACIRALGRLRAPESTPFLIGLLEHPMWARYAADALADARSDAAVSPM